MALGERQPGKANEGKALRREHADGAEPKRNSSLHSSEQQPQRELNQPRIVVLTTNNPKLRVAHRCSRIAELHAIEGVEDFRTELHAKPLGDRSILEHREVVVRNPVRSHSG